MGIPTTTVCSDEFYSLGKAEAECLGVPGLPIAVVPHPVAKLLPNEVAEIAHGVVDVVGGDVIVAGIRRRAPAPRQRDPCQRA